MGEPAIPGAPWLKRFKVTGSRVEYYSCETTVLAETADLARKYVENGDGDLYDSENLHIEDAHENIESIEEIP